MLDEWAFFAAGVAGGFDPGARQTLITRPSSRRLSATQRRTFLGDNPGNFPRAPWGQLEYHGTKRRRDIEPPMCSSKGTITTPPIRANTTCHRLRQRELTSDKAVSGWATTSPSTRLRCGRKAPDCLLTFEAGDARVA